jgi:transposase-like protein
LFQPPYCPLANCPSESGQAAFRFHRHGRYRRNCDGAWVRRFRCLACERAFSTQTFKSNYRYRIPFLHHQLIPLLCSKVNRRQAARAFGVSRKTVERRFERMAEVSSDFHLAQLRDFAERGGTLRDSQLDPKLGQAKQRPRRQSIRPAALRAPRTYRRLADRYALIPSKQSLTLMRDGISCMVPGSWAACKTLRGLERHAAIWWAYRNYVRGLTIKTKTTPAQAAGVCTRRWSQKELLRWRWPSRMLAPKTDLEAAQIPGGSSNQPINSGPDTVSPSPGTGTFRRSTKISSRPSPSKSFATKLCGEVQPAGS